jgi:hypothetical protein
LLLERNLLQEGIKVYNHLLAQHWEQLSVFLKDNWMRIFQLCREQSKGDCFGLHHEMAALKAPAPPKMLARLMALLPTDEDATELESDPCKRAQVVELRTQLRTHTGMYKIGPIFLANMHNGDNRWNHVDAGTL